MNRYTPPLGKWGMAFAYGVLALLLLFCRDSMISTEIVGFYTAQYITLGLILVVGVGFLAANFRRWRELLRDRRVLLLVAAAVICLLPMLAKGDWQLMYFSVLLCVLLGIFLTFFLDWQQLAKGYVCILAVLSVYSVLAAYVLRLGVDYGFYRVPTFINGAEFEFHNFFLAVVPDTYVKNRNFGIFREPGVYQFFLLLGLYLNNDWISWDKPGNQWAVNGILAVTMLTTFATGGVIEMGLLAVVLFLDKKWYRNTKIRRWALGLVVLVLALVVFCVVTQNGLYWAVYDMFIGKFQGGNETGSDRLQSILCNARAFLDSPLVGKPLEQVLYAVLNNTSSTTILLAGFGILGGSLHAAAWLTLVWKRQRGIWANLSYYVILLMSFNTQNLIADVFLWLFPMMALTDTLLSFGKGRKGENHGS